MITIILLSIYLISVILMWLYLHLAHSKNGIFSGLDIGIIDAIVTIIPFLNTGIALTEYISHWPIKEKYDSENKKVSFLNKLFNIKK